MALWRAPARDGVRMSPRCTDDGLGSPRACPPTATGSRLPYAHQVGDGEVQIHAVEHCHQRPQGRRRSSGPHRPARYRPSAGHSASGLPARAGNEAVRRTRTAVQSRKVIRAGQRPPTADRGRSPHQLVSSGTSDRHDVVPLGGKGHDTSTCQLTCGCLPSQPSTDHCCFPAPCATHDGVPCRGVADHCWGERRGRFLGGEVPADEVRGGRPLARPGQRPAALDRPNTRVVGITWVQSSTGLRMPVRAVAEVVRRANEGRSPADRCLLVVDGVHGLAAIDEDAAHMGADVVIAGTHKWLFGPRGTGLVWVAPDVLDQLRPTFVSFISGGEAAPLSPGGFLAFEHAFALPVAVALHEQLGRARVAARITQLSTRVKQGLSRIPGVTVHTPADAKLSAGITCFSVAGHTHQQVVDHAANHRVRLSTSTYTRIGTAVVNTPSEIDTALNSLADLTR
ncbi:aminotransferase class V-fold PLP-dependent enzyme [Streptomyces sp. NPDC054802]